MLSKESMSSERVTSVDRVTSEAKRSWEVVVDLPENTLFLGISKKKNRLFDLLTLRVQNGKHLLRRCFGVVLRVSGTFSGGTKRPLGLDNGHSQEAVG